jgi:hypothetical protein
MSKTVIQPYLFFGGRCEEALEFYKATIEAQIEMVMHFNESPDPLPPDMLQAGFENKDFVPTPPDHPCGQTWMRVSIGFRRLEGSWKVVHEHVSIPFNPMDNQAWFIANPDVADMPDYGGGGESSSR